MPSSQSPPADAGLRQRLYRRAKRAFQLLYDRQLSTGPLLAMERYFPAHAELARLTPLLRQQSRELLPHVETLPRFHELSSTQGRFAYRDGRRWSVLPLRIYGVDLPQNQQRLPALIPFLRAHPEVTGAMVSAWRAANTSAPTVGPSGASCGITSRCTAPRETPATTAACGWPIAGSPTAKARPCCGTTPTNTRCATAPAATAWPCCSTCAGRNSRRPWPCSAPR